MDKINARILARQRAQRIIWWWRFPYAFMLAVTCYLLWLRFDGFVGLFLAVGVGAMGIAVIRVRWRA